MPGPAAEAPLIQIDNISKAFAGVKALREVSVGIRPGSIHALVGENGAGKSTLINILSGLLRPDHGRMTIGGHPFAPADPGAARGRGVATVHQEADVFPDLSVAENLAFEHGWPAPAGWIRWRALRADTAAALAELRCSLDPARPAATLTPAERQLVNIAAALGQAAVLLILDEPTSSLSAAETQILFDRLRRFRRQGGAILYVSHRMEEIFELADTVTVLRDGRKIWTGPLADTHKDRLIALMVGREAPAPAPRSAAREGAVRLASRGLTAADGSFRDVTLEVRAGEVLGLYGLVGAGRSEWAQAVFGLRSLAAGTVFLDSKPFRPRGPGEAARCGLAYLPEDRLRLGLCAGLSVRLNSILATLRRLAAGPFVFRRQETRRARALVERLAIRLRSVEQPAGTLSGGNQQKVVLGRWLDTEPGTLLLDEPTRGVDVATKAEIHALLRRLAGAGCAVVLISSELPEILAHSDRVGVFRDGRLVRVTDAGAATPESVAALALPAGSTGEAERAGRTRSERADHRAASLRAWLREGGLLLAVALLAAFLGWKTDTFWLPGTLRDVGESAALLVLSGLGAALVILAGGIDISLGSIMALAGALGGHLMREGWSPILATATALAAGSAAGGLNAGLALVGRVHPIVITLGTMSLYRGLTLVLIGSRAIHEVPAAFRLPLQAAPLGVPSAVWLALAALLSAWWLLGWTVPGRAVLALGSNPAMARRVGIHRGIVWPAVFGLQGFLAAVAAIVALGRAGHLQGTDFEETTLEAIGVAVVGGIAITGGRGSVWGVAGAALLFRVLEKGWALLHISAFWQRTLVGMLLLLAILGDRLWRRAGARTDA